MKTEINKLKLWQKRYILSVKILLSVVFAGTVGFIFYHVPFDSIFLYPLYVFAGLYLLWLYSIEDAKMEMVKDWQDWMDNKLNSPEYARALLYMHHRQMESSLDPTSPILDWSEQEQLNYEAFLNEKFANNEVLKDLYR